MTTGDRQQSVQARQAAVEGERGTRKSRVGSKVKRKGDGEASTERATRDAQVNGAQAFAQAYQSGGCQDETIQGRAGAGHNLGASRRGHLGGLGAERLTLLAPQVLADLLRASVL